MASRKDILDYVYVTYGTKSEHLWEKYPNYEVFRHQRNTKWYGLVLDIPKQKLGLEDDGITDILIVKSEPELIATLVGQKGFAPAYHMNKTHWISILLDGTVSDDEIYNLLDMSYGLTGK